MTEANTDDRPGPRPEGQSLRDALQALEEIADSFADGVEPTGETRTVLGALAEALPTESMPPEEVAAAEKRWALERRRRIVSRVVLAAAAVLFAVSGVVIWSHRSGTIHRDAILAGLADDGARDSVRRFWDLEAAANELDGIFVRGDKERAVYEPRAAIAEPTPTFRFNVEDRSLTYRIVIIGVAGRRVYDGILVEGEQSAGGEALATFTIPPSEPLDPGSYTWRSELDARAHPRVPTVRYRSAAHPFTILDPRERQRLIDFESTGRTSLDELVRAAALLSARLATEAKSVLESMEVDALDARESVFRDLLLVEARSIRDELVNRGELDALRHRARQLDRP